MTITRPPSLSEEEAREYRARGGTVYQSSHDPRVSYLLNWFLGLVAVLLAAGGIGTFNLLADMRDQLRDLTNKPPAATADQVAYLQRQIDEIKSDITKERDRARH